MESNSKVPPGTVSPKAEFHANKALKLDENLVGAYLALGEVKTRQNYDLAERERYYNLALLKNPNHKIAHLWLANNFTVQGKFKEAEREILLVQELDPLSQGVRVQLTELYYYWRKPDQSIEQAELMLSASPGNETVLGFLAKAYVQKGDFDKAFAALEKTPSDCSIRTLALAAVGRTDEARKITENYCFVT